MQEGNVFCARAREGQAPESFGPVHKDLTKAKVWLKAQKDLKADEEIVFCEVRRVGRVRVRAIDIDFGDEVAQATLPEPEGAAPTEPAATEGGPTDGT